MTNHEDEIILKRFFSCGDRIMGNCFGRCCLGGRDSRFFCFKGYDSVPSNWRRYARSMYYDRGSSVEFESLMDDSPRDEPLSIPVITNYEKFLVANCQYDVLVEDQQLKDVQVERELARQEEMLELEEEAFIEARQEAARIVRLAKNRHQIINPARLLFRNTGSESWLGEEETEWNASEVYDENFDNRQVCMRPRGVGNRGCRPGAHSRTESVSSNGNGSSLVSRDRAYTNCSTPPSSIDLEWEHEAGFYFPPCQSRTKTEDDLTVTLGSEKCTTPLSNELEWDDGFVSAEMADLDLETEQLISEIEQLTSDALQDTKTHSSRKQR